MNKIYIMSVTLAVICVSESVSFLLGCKVRWIWLLPWFLFSISLIVCIARGDEGDNVDKVDNVDEGNEVDKGEEVNEEGTRKEFRIVSLRGDDSNDRLDITTLVKNKEITMRVYNILLKNNITNLMDLTMYTAMDMYYMRGMGKKSSACLRKVMRKYNIRFNSAARRKIMR